MKDGVLHRSPVSESKSSNRMWLADNLTFETALDNDCNELQQLLCPLFEGIAGVCPAWYKSMTTLAQQLNSPRASFSTP